MKIKHDYIIYRFARTHTKQSKIHIAEVGLNEITPHQPDLEKIILVWYAYAHNGTSAMLDYYGGMPNPLHTDSHFKYLLHKSCKYL